MSSTQTRIVTEMLNTYLEYVDEQITTFKDEITDMLDDESRLGDIASDVASLRTAYLVRHLTVELLTAVPNGDGVDLSDTHLARFVRLGDLPDLKDASVVLHMLNQELKPVWGSLTTPAEAAPPPGEETLDEAMERAARSGVQLGEPDAR